MAFHAFYGAVAALPTRRRDAIVTMAVSAMLIDVDHLAYYLGLPIPPRTSHSLMFLVLAPIVMGVCARAGVLGRDITPRMAASMALSVVMAHLAWDTLTGGETRVPFWLPFSRTQIVLSAPIGTLLEVGAVAIVWLAASAESAHTRLRRPRSGPAPS
jgi:hypothetical protein